VSKQDHIKSIIRAKNNISIFKNMADVDIARIIKDIEFISFNEGEYIIKRGDTSKEIYLLIKGECSVVVNGNIVATIKQQQTFGEISPITKGVRQASIRANCKSQVIMFNLDIELVEKNMTGFTLLYKNFVNELIGKLEASNKRSK
jgi:signal-transduction protein with cAMP-binding, CBS, and nucleotidyltransferase domain